MDLLELGNVENDEREKKNMKRYKEWFVKRRGEEESENALIHFSHKYKYK